MDLSEQQPTKKQSLVRGTENWPSAAQQRHYSVQEVAVLWQLSKDSVRRLFKNEPGVLAISPRQRRGKRAYVTLRIPSSVVERVHRRLSLVKVLTT
jgi:hypothetical protein